MLSVDDTFFNSVFISYSRVDEEFAKDFKKKLQDRLGSSIHVWMDNDIPDGKGWRQDILKHLNSTALVVVIMSPDAIQSSWVLYEWNYSLLVLQDDPFLVYRKECDEDKLRLFKDYQLKKPVVWDGEIIIDGAVENIAKRFEGYEELRKSYDDLTNQHETDQVKERAANALGNAPASLSVAGTNYLIASLQFWLERNHSGYVLAHIAINLGRIGKRKAASVVMQAYLKQSTGIDVIVNPIKTALEKLTCDDPV